VVLLAAALDSGEKFPAEQRFGGVFGVYYLDFITHIYLCTQYRSGKVMLILRLRRPVVSSAAGLRPFPKRFSGRQAP